jgi:REP element-mobilizing transposase RayT
VSYLEHHLRRYTRRNTSDFFIHKDLKGFLSRELDFYLKNEVLNLDEMERAGEDLAEGWFQLLRIIKRIGMEIIEFLAQIENFQKMLWEKKKFVTETFYCITVGSIPEDFYPEIAQCEAQWEEWKALGIMSGSAGVPPAPLTAGSAGVPPASSEQSTLFTPSEGVAVPPTPLTAGSAGISPATSHKGYYSRGYLPHYDATNTYQFITLRLHDSVPAEIIERWKQELHWREGLAADSKEAIELRRRIEEYADKGYGACYLRDERIARLVHNALMHFDGVRYRLIAWCIMPNHVHVLLQMMGEPLAKIVQSWKSFTAHEANKLLGRTGRFWMPDYFDRFIRDEAHFNATVEYILHNPVQAGLVDAPEKWQWSGFIPTNMQVDEITCGRDARVPSGGSGGIDADDDAGGRDARVPSETRVPSGGIDADEQDTCTAAELDARAACSHEPQQLSEQDIQKRIALLKAHPTLVLDTRHFPPDFTDRLLAHFENLDDAIDGLLVHSENWQALNLLQERYRGRVKCIYIDPPYNTARLLRGFWHDGARGHQPES